MHEKGTAESVNPPRSINSFLTFPFNPFSTPCVHPCSSYSVSQYVCIQSGAMWEDLACTEDWEGRIHTGLVDFTDKTQKTVPSSLSGSSNHCGLCLGAAGLPERAHNGFSLCFFHLLPLLIALFVNTDRGWAGCTESFGSRLNFKVELHELASYLLCPHLPRGMHAHVHTHIQSQSRGKSQSVTPKAVGRSISARLPACSHHIRAVQLISAFLFCSNAVIHKFSILENVF